MRSMVRLCHLLPELLGTAARVPTGSISACEPYRHVIEATVAKGLSTQRIWQDLKEDYHFSHGYCLVKRFLREIRRHRPEIAAVMEHPPGEEAQVEFFQGPPTLDSASGRWRRPWIFRMVLSCCGHSYEEPMWRHDRVSFILPTRMPSWISAEYLIPYVWTTLRQVLPGPASMTLMYPKLLLTLYRKFPICLAVDFL